MSFRRRVFVLSLICSMTAAMAQSAKNPQTSEDKQGKKPSRRSGKKASQQNRDPGANGVTGSRTD